ncbi:glycosyltransferase [Candidatus Odyssella thessalonicensis]|uniref:glycosyltransferase n=1 Tax=Candidatus Odyssella thessalonicensis TaxID=84647 RepID=UPI000225B253|nr:glycosyltransferase [Candidatus Odyssella thessalonicensis]
MIRKLLVIIPDRLSILINKGEVVPRYYNPGNLFEEVHIMMTNDDKPDPKFVQPMVGDARLFLYNHPEPSGFFKKTLGWQPFLMREWLEDALRKIEKIYPSVMRCYGMHLNLLIAAYVRNRKKIPLLASIHTHPYLDAHKEKLSLKNNIIKRFSIKLANNLHYADLVMPVYQGIISFLQELQVNNYEILYNTVAVSKANIKLSFDYDEHFKLVCIGQQIPNKNPEHLIKAVAKLENVSLDIIGDGVLNSFLKKLAHELKVEDRIKFISSIPHVDLCRNLKNYDCFAGNIDCIGISKTVIEAFLVKLPVLLNINSHEQVPELNDSLCLRVPNTPEGYARGIDELRANKSLRISLAQRAYDFAWKVWAPEKTEAQHIEIYKRYLPQ